MGFIKSFNLITPFVTVLISLVLSLLYLKSATNIQNKKIAKTISFYFLCGAVNWGLIILFYVEKEVFVFMNSLLYVSLLLVHIFFYKFLFILTRINSDKQFSNLHYIFPVAIFLIMSTITFITPYNEQLTHFLSGIRFSNNLFSLVSDSKFIIRLVVSILYLILSTLQILKYRKEIVNYSSNYDKSSLKWLLIYLFLSLDLLIVPIAIIFNLISLNSVNYLFFTFILVFKHVFLIWNIIKENYILLAIDITETEPYEIITSETDNYETVTPDNEKTYGIVITDFERIMLEKRPFLNPDVRLTDIAILINTNRTYLSTFINNTYKVNFNTLMNRYRFEEYKQLKNNVNLNKTEKELIEMAGFSNYRNFKYYYDNYAVN